MQCPSRKTILILSSPTDDSAKALRESLQQYADTFVCYSIAEVAPHAAAANAVIAWYVPRAFVVDTVAACPNAVWLHSRAAGLDWLVYPAVPEPLKRVQVTVCRTVYSSSLAEFAMLGALYFEKTVQRLQQQQAAHNWQKFLVPELRGKTLGVVGYGDIGHACAALARAFGMRIMAVRRKPGDEQDVYPTEKLNWVLGQCHYVVLAMPLTSQTLRCIGREQFAAMRRDAVLINVGRGATVDEDALVAALKEGTIAGAALDVTAVEPLPKESALWDLPNVLISPHNADNTPDAAKQATDLAIENVKRFCTGQELLYVANPAEGY